MSFTAIIFWILLLLLFHAYFGYGLIVFCLSHLAKRKTVAGMPVEWPGVTIVIPAYNEATVLPSKILNTLSLSYPGNIHTIVAAQGSTDGTAGLVSVYPSVQFLLNGERKGKAAAINEAMQQVRSSIVIFSDADSLLNREAVLRMIAWYSDPHTGGVSGEKKISAAAGEAGTGERLYWQYESTIKQWESTTGSVIGAPGELFSMRTFLFDPIPEDTLLDDFVLSAGILKKGLALKYERGAFATESPAISLREEAVRKWRLGAGAAQTIPRLGWWPYPGNWLNFQYYSRRIIRWLIGPPALPVLLLCNILLLHAGGVYVPAFFIQVVFYIWALVGYVACRQGTRAGWLVAPFYFVFMNVCLLAGFVGQCISPQSGAWRKARRLPLPENE